jgi:hypothetical protein
LGLTGIPLDPGEIRIFGHKKIPLKLIKGIQNLGWNMVRINSLFIADLKRLADLKRKMDEFDELGKGLKAKLF